jgi:hypothetical protein
VASQTLKEFVVIQAVLTLNGNAQALSAATVASRRETLASYPCQAVMLQPDTANNAVILVGDADVSDTAYAFRLEAPDAGVPPAPFILEFSNQGPIRLSDIYVKGTNAEKLRIGVVVF